MNKKFSTLLTAGFLIAGSFVGDVYAAAYGSGNVPTQIVADLNGILMTTQYESGYYYLLKNEDSNPYFITERQVGNEWIPGVGMDEPTLWRIDFTTEYDGAHTATIKSLEHGTQLKFDETTGNYSADGDVAKLIALTDGQIYSFRNKTSYITNTIGMAGVTPTFYPLVMNATGGSDAQFFLIKAGKLPVDAAEMNKYFAGHFQLAFKQKADLKDNLENVVSNPLIGTDITAVDFNGSTYFRVSGAWNGGGTTDLWRNTAFRNSSFLVVDTIKNSTSNDLGYSLTIAKGSEMVKATIGAKEATRNLVNAQFDVTKNPGTSRLFISAPNAKYPKANNGEGLAGHTVNATDNEYITVYNNKGQNYIATGTDAHADANAFITYGTAVSNLISDKAFNGGIVTLTYYTSAGNKVNKDKALVAVNGNIDAVDVEYVDPTTPEAQFVQKYVPATATEPAYYEFVNRENGDSKTYNYIHLTTEGMYVAFNDYSGSKDTLIVKNAPARGETGILDGYLTFSKEEQDYKNFNISVATELFGNVFLTEPKAGHFIELSKEATDAAEWTLEEQVSHLNNPWAKETVVDTIYNIIDYKVWSTDKWVEKKDTTAAIMYRIKNALSDEYLAYNENKNAYELVDEVSKPWEWYNDAPREIFFVLKKKFGKVNLVQAKRGTEVLKPNAKFEGGKLYGSFSDNKVSKESNMYKITDNDLFNVTEVREIYRNLGEWPLDTVKIYRADNEKVLLYEDNEDTSVKDSINFLGISHITDVPGMKAAMFVDTAYVRNNTLMPQYMFAVGSPVITYKKEQCSDPSHQPHETTVVDKIEGRYLVDLADSAAVYAKYHKNPYMYDTYNRLGFVDATHTGDKLIIKNDEKEIVLNEGLTVASFALAYVDNEVGSFKMRTQNGWVKYINGATVVVADKAEADVFNLAKTSETPTANDAIEATEVSVVAGNGTVTIKGAAGKKVVICNLLGQAIVNTVIASDEATIPVSAGVFVVAVDGEVAVKAIVK